MTTTSKSVSINARAGAAGPGWRFMLAAPRAIAMFLGLFTLLNLAGRLASPAFDMNLWWIDLKPLPELVGVPILLCLAMCLIAWSVRPELAGWRRKLTEIMVIALSCVALGNTMHYYALRSVRFIHANAAFPFSVMVGLAMLVVLAAIKLRSAGWDRPLGKRGFVAFGMVLLGLLILFPLGQMYCFGMTDYSRHADAIVVFGAGVDTQGRPSNALCDRVATGCRLYKQGLAGVLILSGGPGPGPVSEPQAMRKLALEHGVPESAIVLDAGGVSTMATVKDTAAMFEQLGVREALAVSHFYHLPRIKMTYQRYGREVYTVPAEESQSLRMMPYYLGREVLALWAYYFHIPTD
ncbi:MAG: YdcF family protein [Planctomycetes bacterium]|nr:YdcF family protein [Planctomycetota bacterium]